MWENEVDVAADTDYTSAAGHFECVLYRGQSLQRDSHALSYLNLITTLQVGVIPTLQLRNGGSERLGHFPEVTQQVCGRVAFGSQVCLTPESELVDYT